MNKNKLVIRWNKVFYIALITFIILILLTVKTKPPEKQEETKQKLVREARVAGSWYPNQKEELASLVDSYFSKAEDKNIEGVRALIVPHAGYTYSGQVAANGFFQIKNNYTTVLILAPSHHIDLKGAAIVNATHYKTPLGEIKVSDKTEELVKKGFLVIQSDEGEHSIEAELPFLQQKLGNFEIIPILVGEIEPKQLADLLTPYVNEKTLLVVSTDLSHYYTYDKAVSLDTSCTNSILSMNGKDCEMCGYYPVLTLIEIAKNLEWEPTLIDYKNSGDVGGDKSRVVGYSSIAFSEQKGLNNEEKEFLVQLARKTLEAYYNETEIKVNEDGLPNELIEEKGCFVTLNKNNQLRGCIGHIQPQEKLYKCVIDNALNAALHDIRFTPVENQELNDLDIEISVLSVPEELKYEGSEELLERLVPMKDGVVLTTSSGQSTFLPQVLEQIPDKTSFLDQLCLKQGAVEECWKSTTTRISTYQAQVFSE